MNIIGLAHLAKTIKMKGLERIHMCYRPFFLIIFGLFLLLPKVILAGDYMLKEKYIIADGSTLIMGSLENGHLSSIVKILDCNKWSYICWPSYNLKNGNIYFEAIGQDEVRTTYIYSINPSLKKLQPQKILKGRKPSLSPDGSLLAYYRHPNQLWILNIKDRENKLMATDIPNRRPAVWISQYRLLYNNLEDMLIILDTSTGKKKLTGYDGIVAGALSPDGKKVLCVDAGGRKVFLYFIETNELSLLKKSKYLSIGSSFVWSADGNSFLYTRQTWANQMKLLEGKDMFYYTIDGKERRVLSNIALFGGFALPIEILKNGVSH